MADGPDIVLDRLDAVRSVLEGRDDALVVCGLGNTCWDVYGLGDDERNFYLWGAMGGTAMLGLGVALAQPDRSVIVITGDGDMLMGLGSLATIALQRPANLDIVVIDNERYGETGMQKTHTHFETDLAAVASAAGIAETRTVHTPDQLRTAAAGLFAREGPTFTCIKVTDRAERSAIPPRHGPLLKDRFRLVVLGPRAATD